MRKIVGLILFFGSITLGIYGCMEEPNPVGSQLLPASDLLKIDTTTIMAAKSFSERAVPNSSFPPRILVGKTPDYESWGLIRFSQIPDSLLFVNVLGTELNLRVTYHFGDSLAPFSMDVHRVLKAWGSDSLRIDSLRAPGFFEPSPVTRVNAGPIGDSITVSIPLDTALVRSWLHSPLDTVATNFGVLLKPTNFSSIKGFATSISSNVSYRPQLVVRYTREGSAKTDTVMFNGSTDAFAAFTNNTPPFSDSTRIYVKNGLSYRGMIDFDISSLPAGSSIHKAILEVSLDAVASQFNSYTKDSLYAYFVTENGVISDTLISPRSEPTTVNGRKVYQFPVTTFVQVWISRSNNPRRIALAGYAEDYSLDSFVLFGAASAFKPKLTITFSPVR